MKLLKYLNLMVLSFMLVSCSEATDIEASIKFYDPEQHDHAMQALDAHSVPYRVAPDGQIFYLYQYQEIVDQIRAQIFGQSVLEPPRGAIVKGVDAPRISELLTEAGISYKSIQVEGSERVGFSWDHTVDDEAMKIVSKVVVAREQNDR